MLAARGVSLGLGKINLSDLHQLPSDRLRTAQLKKDEKEKEKNKPRIRIIKKADAKTVWAACRAVIFGCIIIAVGLTMTILGYFDKHFSERIEVTNGVESVQHDKFVQYQLKSMQYLGPVLMGIGSFILIIACVVTLESRDKHAQIITEESISNKKKRLLSLAEEDIDVVVSEHRRSTQISVADEMEKSNSNYSITVEIHRPTRMSNSLAPLADIDSLDLHSCASDLATDREASLSSSNHPESSAGEEEEEEEE